MSLCVHTFLLSADGSSSVIGEILDRPEGVSDSAGPESWRTKVWGSQGMRSLDAKFFPVLADLSQPNGALIVMPDELPELFRECREVREFLSELIPADLDAAAAARLRSGILERLANVEIAAGRALGVGGGVLIW
ncbi:hypothetical protein ACFXHA_40930 [Nocardia sp. NPDC059240]|uniref:hypothetical protein n=1 Tax=Nocardia sp. NPDC059240 TaxID=3346786 RepID=UPI00368E6FAC